MTNRHAIRSRAPVTSPAPAPAIVRDRDVLASHLEDAAHFPGGHLSEMVTPANEADTAQAVRTSGAVLAIGAQSSLTGGATPMGERLINTARLNRIESIGTSSVRVGAGVSLAELDAALASAGRYYPPGPTFAGAFVGGMIATNAAGAATFKYGTTRAWVESLTVVLPEGDVLDIERGAVIAHPDGYFELALQNRQARIPVPTYRMPQVPKLSAGYFAAPAMDLVDLFVGSEGTLGIVTAATLRVLPIRPDRCLAFVPFADAQGAYAFAGRLRRAAVETWRSLDPRGLDVAAIEHMDRRALELVREDGADVTNRVRLTATAASALLVTLELLDTTAEAAFDQIGRALDTGAPDTPLVRFCRLLAEAGVLDDVEIAVPGDEPRATQLLAVREAVPDAVNRRVGRAKRDVDARIEKTAADVIVPIGSLDAMIDFCSAECQRRGLDAAVWGHISDGNLHPNVLTRSYADVERGKEAMLAIGREAIRLGGAPLAEHGVGRNPVKQQLLAELYGSQGIDQMRRVKRAIDPEWKLAPGVLFTNA